MPGPQEVTPYTSPLDALPQRVWVEHRPDGHSSVVYWAAPEAPPSGFVGYNVYRSPEPCSDLTSSSLTKLTDSPIGLPFLIDDVEPLGVPAYLVTQVDTSGEHAIDRPVQLGDTSDDDRYGERSETLSMARIYAEFRRRKEILLELNGERTTILVRRLSGRRCPRCFRGTAEAGTRADCHVCWGTSWDRGYEPVVDVRCRIGTLYEAIRLQPPGLEFRSNPKCWLVGFPLVRQGDVLVRPKEGKRYEIQRVSLTVHGGVLTGQDFEAVAFDPNHPIYNFPL